MALFEPLFAELNESGGRYVVVGGVAVVLHGFARLTADLDLAVDLDQEQVRRTISALVRLGFVPRIPVDPLSFADPVLRERWRRDHGTRVFNLYDPGDPLRSVDLFVDDPVPFSDLWARAEVVHLRSVTVRIASIADLVKMKERAGRPQDHEDIEALQAIEARKRGGS
jgi:hypothetical protein